MTLMADVTAPSSVARHPAKRYLHARLVPDLRSSPCMGKSEIVHSIAKEYQLELIDVRPGQCDATELNGLPRFTKDGRADHARFTNFPLELDALPEGTDGCCSSMR